MPIPTLALAPELIALLSVIAPMIGAAALWAWSPPDRTRQGTIALATTWNAAVLLIFNELAVVAGLWQFAPVGPTIGKVPVVLWLGWTLLWGTLAAQSPLAPRHTLVLLGLFDLIYMPLLSGVLVLGSFWLVGEIILLAFVAWPSLLIVHWTTDRRRLWARSLFQLVMFACILFWVIPSIAAAGVDQTLRLNIPPISFGAVLLAHIVSALPGALSVHEFFLHGGTPWPWESTRRVVRSGPYRFVRSPMQASGVLVLSLVTVLYRQPAILIALVLALAYSGMFSWSEGPELTKRFGQKWSVLVRKQHLWWPTWRPSSAGEPATIWVDLGCNSCAPLATFLQERQPVQLQIQDANDHQTPINRLCYERDDGTSFSGVVAFGASLEHLNLGWAMIGWILRLPGLQWFWVLVSDSVGFGPQPVSGLQRS